MPTQVTIPLDAASLARTLNGNKTYLLLLTGAAVIVLNHFGLLPPEYVPAGLDPKDWINQLYLLAFGATGRSALKKLEADVGTVVPPEKIATVESAVVLLQPLFTQLMTTAVAQAKAAAAQDAPAKPGS